MKAKNFFVCENCGAEFPRWGGQCSGCGEWNTLTERTLQISKAKSLGGSGAGLVKALKPEAANKLTDKPLLRIQSGIGEADRVLGGGFVPGSIILLAGDPGIGKSTLTLQLAAEFAEKSGKTLIASGEESAEQIALRAQRLKKAHPQLQIFSENNLETILATAVAERPKLLIVDSVQVIFSHESLSMPGSISQIRLVTERLLRFAKTTGTPVILIGHVTKEGDLAGPRVLEHLVDVVLTLEGDPHRDFRLLRAVKNRFGATSEVGVFEMQELGLVEVQNPSAAFLEGRLACPIGSCITATLEGSRPLLVEVQALTSPSTFGYPKRTASGFDLNRLNLLIAVLQNHGGIRLDSSDIFVNVVGGLRLREPAADLAVILALASSKAKKSLPEKLVAWGEVGLTGEIRRVSQTEKRKKEAQKLGFTQFFDNTVSQKLVEILKKI